MDLCLYALPPHRMRSNDVRYMAELSKLVPVVPVIMKADTMTIHEAQVFRQEVHTRLNNPGRHSVRICSKSCQGRSSCLAHCVHLSWMVVPQMVLQSCSV